MSITLHGTEFTRPKGSPGTAPWRCPAGHESPGFDTDDETLAAINEWARGHAGCVPVKKTKRARRG